MALTRDQVISFVKKHLRYPESLVEQSDYDEAIRKALDLINSWTSGYTKKVLTPSNSQTPIRAYPMGAGVPEYSNSLPFDTIDDSLSPGLIGAVYTVQEPWSLENIDKSLFVKQRFLDLVACILNEIIANKVYLAKAIEDLPFNLMASEVLSDMRERIQEIKQDFEEKYVVPST